MGNDCHDYALPVKDLRDLTHLSLPELTTLLDKHAPAAPSRLTPRQVRRILEELGFRTRFRVFSVMNLKGGVGKTTSALALASRAVQYGFRTCILDLDAQASATLALGITPDDDSPIFVDLWKAPAAQINTAIKQVAEDFYVLPSRLDNSLLDLALSSPTAQKRAVKDTCDALEAAGFDLVVIDCPPSLGAAVISASCAAHTVVIPAAGDAFSRRGIALTLQELAAIRETFALPEVQVRILFTMLDRRQKLSTQAHEGLVRSYGERVLDTPIRISTDFARSLESQRTVFASPRKSQAKSDYDRVTSTLLGLADHFSPAH